MRSEELLHDLSQNQFETLGVIASLEDPSIASHHIRV